MAVAPALRVESSGGPGKKSVTLPLISLALVLTGMLVLGGIGYWMFGVEIPTLYAKKAGPESVVLFTGYILSSSGNATVGYRGMGSFSFGAGNPNPGVVKFTLEQSVAPAITIELGICGFGAVCSPPDSSMDIIPLSTQVPESQMVVVDSGGTIFELLNLPSYDGGRPVVSFNLSVTVTLEGQIVLE